MVGANARVLAIGLALLTGLWMVPGSPLATLSPSESERSASALEDERKRLADIREKLVRRQALERTLDRRVDQLAERIEVLGAERARRASALRRSRDEAAWLERRLDRLVPRISARTGVLEQRRAQAGRVLADLAGLSRQVEISSTVRARLLAISPVMLDRLRSADDRLAALRTERDDLVERHRRLQDEAPRLQAQRQRLERERARLRRQHAATRERKREIAREVAALERDQAALAERVIVAETARDASADPEVTPPAAGAPGAAQGGPGKDAVVEGAALAPGALGSSANAVSLAAPRLTAVAVRREPALASGGGGQTVLPPPTKPDGVVGKAELNGTDETGVSRHAALDAGVVGGLSRPLLRRSVEPLLPIPGQVPDGFEEGVEDRDGRSIAISAAPRQPVAAPEGGRVVFAGAFKSYGQLLIIEHDREYHILLWGFSRLDVTVGESVRTGQIVGVMGARGDRAPQLYVELRRNGRPVNPLPWLAASSSKVRG